MMEEFLQEYADHLETWGPNCGAPLGVYVGHLNILLRKLIDACADEANFLLAPPPAVDAIRLLAQRIPASPARKRR